MTARKSESALGDQSSTESKDPGKQPPANPSSARKVPARKAAARKAAARKAAARRGSEDQGQQSKSPEQKAPEKKTPEKKALGKKGSENGSPENKASVESGAVSGRVAAADVVRPVPTSRNAFAAGAARASGERRRRSGTPLLPGTERLEVSAARREATIEEPAAVGEQSPQAAAVRRRPPRKAIRERREERARDRVLRPVRSSPASVAVEVPRQGLASSEPHEVSRLTAREASHAPEGTEARERAQRHTAASEGGGTFDTVAAGLHERAGRLVGAVLEAAEFSSEARPGPAELVELAVNVLRSAATAAGVPAEDVERHVAETLAYIRRRLTGDYQVDEFGFDEDYTTHVHLPLLRPLYRKWFRVEVKGIENIPSEGGALVVANHSGTVAMDSLMTQVAVYDEHPGHRHLRMLGADLVFQTPFVGTIARRSGSTLAAHTDAERLLSGGELVGVWPEGFKGVGKPYSERYKLQRFGRGGFVSAALRTGVPIVPCSIVGAEEIYPILGNMPTVARLLGLPYAPITPTFPWLGPLGMIPLPSKWFIEFGPPIDTTSFGPDAADDPMLVFDLTDQVRETIQQTLYSLLMQRRSVFL